MAKKLKQLLVLVLVVALTATLAISGTVAYLTDRDSEANVFTVGDVKIDLNESFGQGATLTPGVEINKIPTITNTGKNDAYVWMEFAIPAALDNYVQGTETGSDKNVIHWNPLGATADGYVTETRVNDAIAKGLLPAGITANEITSKNMTWNVFNSLGQGTNAYQTKIEVDGTEVDYNVYVLLYNKALEKGETTLPSVFKVFLDEKVDIAPNGDWYKVDAGVATKLDWNTETNGGPIIYVSAYAIQKEKFDTVEDAYAAYNAQWTTDQNVNNGLEWAGVTKKNAATDAELENALTDPNAEGTIVVNLTEDVTYDVAAWQSNAMGNEKVDTIVINGNGNTITFNQTDSDWNNIVTNGAKLVINNATITNAGHNDGPWNRHDLNFACEVELNNVTSDKALALKAGATLKDVVINDANTSDTYAIWIQPNGQTVTLDGVTIDMIDCTGGRGIKIDEKYVTTPKKVTLNVSNTTFKTEEKAAILVKSAAGADITLDNVDISEVAADKDNAVWVDEASAAYYDFVDVKGGNKAQE